MNANDPEPAERQSARPAATKAALAGLVLAGGSSRRMGSSKPLLRFGEHSMLDQMLRILRAVARPLAVIAAPGQPLAKLPADVRLLVDDDPGEGPLAAVRTALAHFAETAERVLVLPCDLPLIRPQTLNFLASMPAEHDIVLPTFEDREQVLTAIYTTRLAPTAAQLVDAGERRLRALLPVANVRRVTREELAAAGMAAHELRNVNSPGDYRWALGRAGLLETPE